MPLDGEVRLIHVRVHLCEVVLVGQIYRVRIGEDVVASFTPEYPASERAEPVFLQWAHFFLVSHAARIMPSAMMGMRMPQPAVTSPCLMLMIRKLINDSPDLL